MSLDSFLVEEKNHEHEACALVSVQEYYRYEKDDASPLSLKLHEDYS